MKISAAILALTDLLRGAAANVNAQEARGSTPLHHTMMFAPAAAPWGPRRAERRGARRPLPVDGARSSRDPSRSGADPKSPAQARRVRAAVEEARYGQLALAPVGADDHRLKAPLENRRTKRAAAAAPGPAKPAGAKKKAK